MADNWQSLRQFEETNLHVLQNGILSDVKFLAGESRKEVKAHKVILASRSPVFYNMFCGSLLEHSDVIEIPDIEEEILKEMLRFLYTEKCDIGPESVMALIYGAKKYELNRLEKKCIAYLHIEMSPANVCLILQHANVFGETELIKRCVEFAFVNLDAVLKSGGIASLSKDMFSHLLESNHFSAKEVDVYEACKQWAAEQLKQKGETEVTHSSIRKELGELLFSIRFHLMDPNIFANRISKEDILTSEEKALIFRSFRSHSAGLESSLLFGQKPKYEKDERITILRYDDVKYGPNWENKGQLYGISFKVSGTVALTGVNMFSPSEKGCIAGSVRLADDQDILTSSEITINFDENCHCKDIIFDKAIILTADKVYTVYQRMEGEDSYFGIKGKRTCTNDRLGITVEFSGCEYAPNIVFGQIRGLIFMHHSDKSEI